MIKLKWLIIPLNLIFLLVYFNISIIKKETLLEEGQLILLELAPVDPRSLMQGDYMSLRYKISEGFNYDSMPRRGYCIVKIDSAEIAQVVRFQKDLTLLHPQEYAIVYTTPDRWNVNIGAESFFFQEGDAQKYEQAKYGGIRVDKKGNSLLIGLFDKSGKLIN